MHLNMSMAGLTDSARDTAETTGAFGHMPYGDVKSYTAIYGMQERFETIQERLFQQFVLVLPTQRRLADLSKAEIETWRQNLKIVLQHLYTAEQFGQQLVTAYDRRVK